MVEVHVELLSEPLYGQRGQVAAVGVDVGEVVAGVVKLAPAREAQPAARTSGGRQGRGEAGVREWEADADIASPVEAIGGVDADVDRGIRVGERTNPSPNV